MNATLTFGPCRLLMEARAGAVPVAIPARVEEDAWVTDELGVCRLSDDWTNHYGHNVYICKRSERERVVGEP